MKTIATQYYGFGHSEHYTIKFVTNAKNKSNGIYIVVDPNGYEHETGLWERVKDYDYKRERYKNTYIYRACSFTELEQGKILRNKKYYALKDVLHNQVCRFIKEKRK